MSVIHHMLQRLDKRRATPSAGEPVVAVPNTSGKRLLGIVLAGGAAVAWTAWGGWSAPQSTLVAEAPVTPVMDSAAPATAGQEPAQAAPAMAPRPAAAPERTTTTPTVHTAAASLSGAGPTPAVAPRPGAAVVEQATAPSSGVAAPTVQTLAALHPRADTVRGSLAPLTPPVPRIEKLPPGTSLPRPQQTWSLALEAQASGHPLLALERAQQVLAELPEHDAARQLAALVLTQQGRTGEAEALLVAAPRSSGLPALQVLRARLMAERGADADALGLLDTLKLGGADADGLRAALLARRGDFAAALPAYEAALRQQPTNPSWWLGLAVSLDASGQAPRARDAYQRALSFGLPTAELAQHAEQRLRALN